MATYLTDIDQARSLGNLTSNTSLLPDDNFREHLAVAKEELREWVSEDVYDAAQVLVTAARSGLEAGENLTEDGDLDTRERRLRLAEAWLTLASMIPALNTIFQGGGIQVSVSAEEGNISVMGEVQIARKVKAYRKYAAKQAGDYLVTGLPSVVISRAKDRAGNYIT